MTTPAAAAIWPTASVVVPVASSWSAPSGWAWMPWAASSDRRVSAWGVRTRTSWSVRAVRAARVDWVTSRPAAMITTWSTVWATSARTWLETSTVRPWSASWRSKPRSQWTPSGSRPLAGSSRISTWGSPSRAVASPRRWRMPSEKPPTRRRAAPGGPAWAGAGAARMAVGCFQYGADVVDGVGQLPVGLAVDLGGAGGGGDQAEQGAQGGGLAGPGGAKEPDHGALADFEAASVDGDDRSEALGESVDGDDRHRSPP